MDDETLARLEHENMLGWLTAAWSQVPGAVVHLADGVGVFGTGLPAPLFNQVVTDDGASAGDIAAGVDILRARATRFCVVLRRPQDDRFRPLMAELGLRLDEEVLPGMALHPIPPVLSGAADGLEIRLVEDTAALREHARTAARGFGIDEDVALRFIGDDLWRREGIRVYLGVADGRPVTAGMSVRTGDTLGIFTIATVPEGRGRGFGRAITERLLIDGAAAGCTVGALQASEMGRPIYERIGFRLVQDYDVYLP